MKLSETQIVKALLVYLQLTYPRGVFWRCNVGAVQVGKRFVRFGVPGMSDIQGVLPGGRACFIEAKTAKGKQSPAQVAFQQAVESAGGLYLLAKSIDDLAEKTGCLTCRAK